MKTHPNKFARLCAGIETPAAVQQILSEAAGRGLHPRVIAGIRWGLFTGEEASALTDSQLCKQTDAYVLAQRHDKGVVLPKRTPRAARLHPSFDPGPQHRRRVGGIRYGSGTLPVEDRSIGGEAAAALRYMREQRDSMSD